MEAWVSFKRPTVIGRVCQRQPRGLRLSPVSVAASRVRGLRITVWDILGWLGAGMTEEQILDEHPDLEKGDFTAVYQFAAETGRKANAG
jgi:hypothetical protein